jgi:hypothetical protein
MIGPRRLLREAERARAFTRRLERTLEPARHVVSGLPGWTILRADERIASLAGAVDPFERLGPVLARIAKPAEAEEHEARIVRRLDRGAAAFGGRRGSARTDVVARERRVAPPEHRSAGEGASAAAVTLDSAAPFRAEHESAPGAAARALRRTLEGAAVSLPPSQTDPDVAPAFRSARAVSPVSESRRVPQPGFDIPVLNSTTPAAARSVRTVRQAASTSHAGAPRTASNSPIDAVTPDVESESPAAAGLTAFRAAAILVERLRVSDTLHAFRSVIRVEAATPVEQGRQASTPSVEWMPSPPRPRIESAAPHASSRAARVDAGQLTSPPPDATRSSSPRAEHVNAPSRAPDIATPAGSSGLRRLAALATESLEAPQPPAVGAVQPAPRTLRLEEELDRLLRAEALNHGIDAEGLVR